MKTQTPTPSADLAEKANNIITAQLRLLPTSDAVSSTLLVLISVLATQMTIQANMADSLKLIAERLEKEGRYV